MSRPDPRTAVAALAGLLRYPDGSLEGRVRDARASVGTVDAGLAGALDRFVDETRRLGPARHEELYTRTFDLSPSCVPYLSVYLFGAGSLERGRLMSGLAGAYRRTGHDPGGELPDHVAVVLAWAPRAPREEWRELVDHALRGPLRQMGRTLEEAGNPYRHLLAAAATAVELARGGGGDG